MTRTTKRVVGLALLYYVFGALVPLAMRYEPWLAVPAAVVAWLFVVQAVRLYRERKAARQEVLRARELLRNAGLTEAPPIASDP